MIRWKASVSKVSMGVCLCSHSENSGDYFYDLLYQMSFMKILWFFFNERAIIWINEMVSLHHLHKTLCAFELHTLNMLGNGSLVVFTTGGFLSWIAGWSSRCRAHKRVPLFCMLFWQQTLSLMMLCWTSALIPVSGRPTLKVTHNIPENACWRKHYW